MNADSPNRLIFTLDFDELVAQLRELEGGPTPDEFLTAIARVGRNNGPALAYDYVFPGNDSQYFLDNSGIEQARERAKHIAPVLHHVWSSAEYPEGHLKHEAWAFLFETAGYRVDGVPATPPQQLTLYRGTTPQRLEAMAWTADRAMAQRFATGGLRGRPQGHVWQVQVTGDQLVAHIADGEEDEYLLHPEEVISVAEHAVRLL